MLSIAKVSNADSAKSYYAESDDYYSEGSTAPSLWQGQGAVALGLAGAVDKDRFYDLLRGKMSNYEQIHNGGEGRRAGTDLTFSPSKSISIQALVIGDDRLIDAHDKAVSRTLEYVENLAAYRVTRNGETTISASGNIIAATFMHETNRDQDPALHTHSVIVGATQTSSGAWRALNITQIYKQQKLLTAYYRSELAQEVKKLGYEITLTHSDGRFELNGYAREQIEAFSQRGAAIEKYLEERGKSRASATSAEKEMATLATRSKKEKVDRAELHAEWKSKSVDLGISSVLPEAALDNKLDCQHAANSSVRFAIDHLIERKSIINKDEILQVALENGVGQTNLSAINDCIKDFVSQGRLIERADKFTTKVAQEREKQMLVMLESGKNSLRPISNEQSVANSLKRTNLNLGQRGAVSLISLSLDRYVAIQGSAGVGKTTMLKEAAKIAESRGFKVFGAAPSASAARELSKAGVDSKTLASHLANDFSSLNNKSILLVDESSMVSTRDMHELMSQAQDKNFRVVLVGDVQQLQSIQAGKAFAQLQEGGIAKASVGEILRQKNSELKSAVEFAARGEVASAIENLKHIVEVDYANERHQRIADDYVKLGEQRKSTIIVAGTNAARESINDKVREGLGLKSEGLVLDTLRRKDLTEAQGKMSASYSIGDIVQTNKDLKSLSMSRGDRAKIVDIEPAKITLEKANGESVVWNPSIQTNVTVFEVREKEFSPGDRVSITANDYGLGVVNGDLAEVKSFDQEKMVLNVDGGKEVALDSTKPQNIDHAYCQTIFASQGQTVERVLIEADTRSLTANENSFYVAISRAENAAIIYTDDKEQLPESMSRSNEKEAALDLGRA